jgi:hypothetical protein
MERTHPTGLVGASGTLGRVQMQSHALIHQEAGNPRCPSPKLHPRL